MTKKSNPWRKRQPGKPSANGRPPKDWASSGLPGPARPARAGVYLDACACSPPIHLEGGGEATLYLATDVGTELVLGIHLGSGESPSGADATVLARRVHLDLKSRSRLFDFVIAPADAEFVDEDFRRTLDQLGVRLILEAG